MSPQQVVSWSEASKGILIPVLLGVMSVVGGWLASELSALRKDLGDLKVQVARVQERVDMHMSTSRSN